MDRLDVAAIFCINVVPTGKLFVGASRGVRVMWYAYLSALRKGQHTNREIQRAYDLYGESAIRCEPLESAKNRDPMEVAMRVRAWAYKLKAVELKRGRPKKAKEPPVAALPPAVRLRVEALLREAAAESSADAQQLARDREARERQRRIADEERVEIEKAATAKHEREKRAVRRQANKLGLPMWAVRQSASFRLPKSRGQAPTALPSAAVDDWGDPA